MTIKTASPKKILSTFASDIDFLLLLHDRAPEILDKIHGVPSRRMLESILTRVEKANDRIERKEQEIEAIETKLATMLLSKKDKVKDAKKIAVAVLDNRYPEAKEKIGL